MFLYDAHELMAQTLCRSPIYGSQKYVIESASGHVSH